MTSCEGVAMSTANNAPIRLPLAEQSTASRPFPDINILCPGRTDSACEESGAPKKMEGMKSRNECTTAAETMMEEIIRGMMPGSISDAESTPPMRFSSQGSMAKRTRARVLTWIPGINPLTDPSMEPRNVEYTIIRSRGISTLFPSVAKRSK